MGYIYIKKDENPPHPKRSVSLSSMTHRQRKVIAGVFFALGLFLFSSAVLPIVQFQFEYSTKFGQIINPLSSRFYNNSGGVLGDVSSADYTQLSNWFVADNHTDVKPVLAADNSRTQGSYKISIPKLKIQDAVVEIGSMDLKKSLIQYPQTSLPGQLGNGVVFGHSVLPQFFNPKSYLTIFSTLYRLKQGDEIFIDYDNIRYRYLIEEMYEVQPTDLSVLEQRFDGRYFTFITCSPPGTYLRRLVVRTRIVNL
ncbi:sortase [Candidatus Shapirobacteria bacterium]|nr:sortase [Candidatus Shapirobacteria bacterium]